MTGGDSADESASDRRGDGMNPFAGWARRSWRRSPRCSSPRSSRASSSSSSGEPAADFWGVIFSKPPSGSRIMVNIINQTVDDLPLGARRGHRLPDEPVQHRRRGPVHASRRTAPPPFAGAAFFPGLLNVLIPLLIAMAVGAIWAGIAGVLKVTRGVSEVISTIMLNAIAVTLVGYLLQRYGQHDGNAVRTHADPGGHAGSTAGRRSRVRPATIWTPGAPRRPASASRFWCVINKTRFGFDLRATGMSQTAAVASGVRSTGWSSSRCCSPAASPA